MFKQIDIYGKEKDVNNLNDKLHLYHGGRISSRSMFRFINGYKMGSYCKNCVHFEKGQCILNKNDKAMKNDIACGLYELRSGKNERKTKTRRTCESSLKRYCKSYRTNDTK